MAATRWHGQHLRLPAGDVVEQGVEGGQALVASAYVVVALVLQVAQEPDDPLEAEVVEAEPADPGPLVLGHEAQQEPDGVPVAAHRRRPQALDGDQVVDEEGVDHGAEEPGLGHGLVADHAGWAKASKRRLASANS
jgi:hypothetical protein